MNKVHGIVLPAEDTHFKDQITVDPAYGNKGVYQIHKWKACIPFIKEFRHALDIGAHVGLWTRVLAYHFDRVTAFEPHLEYWPLWEENMVEHDRDKCVLHCVGLGFNKEMVVLDQDPVNSGKTYVVWGDSTGTPSYTVRLDDIELPNNIDFMKIDCEGYEYFVIQGATQTIQQNKPFILVEQKPNNGSRYGLSDTAACDLLRELGMSQVFEINGDYGFVFPS